MFKLHEEIRKFSLMKNVRIEQFYDDDTQLTQLRMRSRNGNEASMIELTPTEILDMNLHKLDYCLNYLYDGLNARVKLSDCKGYRG